MELKLPRDLFVEGFPGGKGGKTKKEGGCGKQKADQEAINPKIGQGTTKRIGIAYHRQDLQAKKDFSLHRDAISEAFESYATAALSDGRVHSNKHAVFCWDIQKVSRFCNTKLWYTRLQTGI